MRKVIALLFIVGMLAGCTQDKDGKPVAADDGPKETKQEQPKEKAEPNKQEEQSEEQIIEEQSELNARANEESTEYNEVILDEENIKVTLKNISKVFNEFYDEDNYVIDLFVENKSDDKIIVQSMDVSADDLMIDDLSTLTVTISGGKKADAEMWISSDDGELPSLKDNLEFTLYTMDEEYQITDEYKVTIKIK